MKLKFIAVTILTVFLLIAFVFRNPISYVNYKLIDFLFFLRGSWKPQNEKIVVVAVDDESLNQNRYGRWPWKRGAYADFLKKINPAEPSAVVFDISFVLPDESGDEQDAMFKEAIKSSGNVLLAAYFTKDRFWTGSEKLESLVKPLPILGVPAAGMGFVNNVYDADGSIRRAKLVHPGERGSQNMFSLSLQTVLHHLKIPEKDVAVLPRRLKLKWFREIEIPLDSSGYMQINYSGAPGNFITVSFDDVVSDKVPGDVFRNKIVLVGPTAPVLHDIFPTPLAHAGTRPGVDILASSIRTILERKFLARIPEIYPYVFLIVFLIVSSLLFYILSPRISWTVFIGFIIALFSSGYVLFIKGFIFPIAQPLSGLLVLYPCGMVYQYVSERKRRLVVKNAFQHYVNPELVELIVRAPESLKLGGEKKVVSVLFSDIAGFTTISESTPPEVLVGWLNEYLDEMSVVILEYKGTVDKYIGDAIMAFWNAPLEQPDHAVCACRAALQMQTRLRELNDEWAAQGRPCLQTRIGINTGEVIVGNMGSSKRFDYTIIGDEVNLASRLERINKYYGTSIITSFPTYHLAMDHIEARQLDYIKVKGKNEPVYILELLDEKGMLTKSRKVLAGMFEKALHPYRLGRWDEAIGEFELLAEKFPNDKSCQIFLKRCLDLKANPPHEWNGVYTFDKK